MPVLVDTSVWIEYFRTGNCSETLDFLIEENLVVINDLVLAELVPFLRIRGQRKIIDVLHNVKKLDLVLDWNQLVNFQVKCLKNGLNGIGIPDLIIAQNAKQNRCEIYSRDRHFDMLKDVLNLQLM